MPIVTLRDTPSSLLPLHADANGNVSCGPSSNGNVWYFPLGAILVLSLVISLLHPPLLLVVAME